MKIGTKIVLLLTGELRMYDLALHTEYKYNSGVRLWNIKIGGLKHPIITSPKPDLVLRQGDMCLVEYTGLDVDYDPTFNLLEVNGEREESHPG